MVGATTSIWCYARCIKESLWLSEWQTSQTRCSNFRAVHRQGWPCVGKRVVVYTAGSAMATGVYSAEEVGHDITLHNTNKIYDESATCHP